MTQNIEDGEGLENVGSGTRRGSVIESINLSVRRSSIGQGLVEAASKLKEAGSKLSEVTESVFSGETIKQWVDFIKLLTNIATILSTFGLCWVVFYIKSDLLVASIFENLIMFESDSKASTRAFGILVNLIAGGAVLQIVKMNLEEKTAGTSEDAEKSKSFFKKITYYLFSYFTIAAYITALVIIVFLIGKHKNFQALAEGGTSVNSDDGAQIIKVLNDNSEIDCDADLGVVLCKIRYQLSDPSKLATCETKCAILALETKYQCCGLGGNNNTISGTAVSEACRNKYSADESGRIGRSVDYDDYDTVGAEGISPNGISNTMYEWSRQIAIGRHEKDRQQREAVLARSVDLPCVPGETHCTCDPYLNDLGFSTIWLLGGLSLGNILILVMRNVFEACFGKKKKANEEEDKK
jgi:hypothetical protein